MSRRGPLAYVDGLGYMRCAACARDNEREAPVDAGDDLCGVTCDGCGLSFAAIAAALAPAPVSPDRAVPWIVVDRETAYGSTARLPFGIKVF